MHEALGAIEVVGLVAGIEAADAACKTADVELVGYELAKGGGLVTIKITGQVSAVQASVQAARQAAERLSRVAGTLVIPRPDGQLGVLIHSATTIGHDPTTPTTDPALDEDLVPGKPTGSPAPAKASTATTTTSRRKQS